MKSFSSCASRLKSTIARQFASDPTMFRNQVTPEHPAHIAPQHCAVCSAYDGCL